MVHYEENVTIVIETLKKYRYGTRAISMSGKCYARLKLFTELEGIAFFSPELALRWCETQVANTYMSQYRLAICRLNDIYVYGRVLGTHLRIHTQLSDDNSRIIDNYISSLLSSDCYTVAHIKNIKHACTQFCCFTQYNGTHFIGNVDYQIIELYDSFLRESSSAYFITEGLVVGFLKYLVSCGMCRIGLPLFIHYIESGKCTSFKNMAENVRHEIESRRKESLVFPPDEFYQSIPHFKERLAASGYSRTVTDSAPYHLTLLFLFLDRENLGYDRTIMEKWFGCVGERLFGSGMYMARRTYEMYDDYAREGDVIPRHRWKHRKSSYDLLPSWCREELDAFIGQKKKEGWDKNTIDMYLQCNIRFCQFLASENMNSFDSLTPEAIKQFNLSDRHQTMEAKNAYNSRIRKFLIHLELKNAVQGGLHFALCNQAAGSERIVETFSEEDCKRIQQYCERASTPLGLRDAAMLRIGMEMGFRASDIVSLRFSDIDWNSMSIRIIQEKTRREHRHPMNVRTGNAIFRYLRDGRRKHVDSSFIFISIKAPYGPVTGMACRDALIRAGASTGKFHQTRKTYGSATLNGGATLAETAELLGHADTSNVHKYISLDRERMRLCPLSLTETDLPLEGRFPHE